MKKVITVSIFALIAFTTWAIFYLSPFKKTTDPNGHNAIAPTPNSTELLSTVPTQSLSNKELEGAIASTILHPLNLELGLIAELEKAGENKDFTRLPILLEHIDYNFNTSPPNRDERNPNATRAGEHLKSLSESLTAYHAVCQFGQPAVQSIIAHLGQLDRDREKERNKANICQMALIKILGQQPAIDAIQTAMITEKDLIVNERYKLAAESIGYHSKSSIELW